MNVWVRFLVFWNYFGGKKNEYSKNGRTNCMLKLNVICSRVLFVCKFRESKLLVVAVEIHVYAICQNLFISRHSSCFFQKLNPKPKNVTQTFIFCKVLIEKEKFSLKVVPYHRSLQGHQKSQHSNPVSKS